MNKSSLILPVLVLLSGCHNACYEEYKPCMEECDENYRSCCEVENCPDYSRSQLRAREEQ